MAWILLLILASLAQAQPAFETVSIKRPTRSGVVVVRQPGEPPLSIDELRELRERARSMRPDPSQFECRSCSLESLMRQAYRVSPYQLSTPSSMQNYRFDVVARLPPGTDRDQVPLMIQNLLADRFQLVIRREQKEKQVYELVAAEGGPKFQEAVAGAAPAVFDPDDDFEGTPGGWGVMPGRIRLKRGPIGNLVNALTIAMHLSKPIVDATGLKGEYEFTLHWKYERFGRATPSVSLIKAALQSELGLKLKEAKRPIEVIVVEHVRKPVLEN